MIKMVVSDMDGTLLHDDKTLNKGIYKYLDYFIKNNIKFVLASGRQVYNLEEYFLDYVDKIALIGENGANLRDNNKTLCTKFISHEDSYDVLLQLESIDKAEPILCADGCAYISNADPSFIYEAKKYYTNVIIVEDLKEVDVKIFKIAIHDTLGSAVNSNIHLKIKSDNIIKLVSSKEYLDIMPKDANKGAALKVLCDKYNIKKDEILCFGDYLNDIEMLNCSEYSYALANAVQEVKDICKYKTLSNNEDGVLKVLSEYFNNI